MYRYWMVHRTVGGEPLAAKHLTLSAAMEEAQRLAKANPGVAFVVLEAQYMFQTTEPIVVKEYLYAQPAEAKELSVDNPNDI